MDAVKRRHGAPARAAAAPLQPGRPWPLGATWDGHGVNFAVFSSGATRVELCIFDAQGLHETRRLTLPERSNDIWHGYLSGVAPGLVYGLRVDGPWRPERGQLFNPAKLLLDPYARELVGQFSWRSEYFGADRSFPLHRDAQDNAAWALKARVVHDEFDWGEDRHPVIAAGDTVLYEVHVKGFSRLQTAVPQALRGTFAGLAHPASIQHLRQLGITSVSLLPVAYALDEERLVQMGLHNYWGYNTIAFFCVDPALAVHGTTNRPRDEFRSMVRSLHGAGIEVLLDVVFNHTAEGDETGPTISFRGLDNAAYYRLPPDAPSRYENQSGCGNTLDIRRPAVLRLVLDCLRYWVTQMHVDGFRFDLAPVLGRGDNGFERGGAFFTAIAQDPVLSTVKLIAEPWDIGTGGYQLGGFPRGWLEWNDRFRDNLRSFWLGGHHAPDSPHPAAARADFAMRLCGSSDIYQARHRPPAESVNFITAHDGFSLRDLVSFNQRHNEANGENNRDGHGHNLSFNCGVEGDSTDPAVNQLRGRLQRALLASTLLAQGTPMLCAGDEIGHSQGGNNNPYCQDNATTWIDWSKADADLAAFVARVLELRRQARPFGMQWYNGLTDALGLYDLSWLEPDGSALQGEAWRNPRSRALACLIGRPGHARAPLLLLVNAAQQDQSFRLPAGVWQSVLDSAEPRGFARWHGQGESLLEIAGHSLQLLAAAGSGIT